MTTQASAERIASALGKAKRSGRGFMCSCPAHDDGKPSFYISDGSRGWPVFKCFTGCDRKVIVDALKARGLWPREPGLDGGDMAREHVLMPVPPDAQTVDWPALSRPKPTSLFGYRDKAGHLLHAVARWDKPGREKEIRPVVFVETSDGQRHWMLRGVPEPRPLYGLQYLAQHPDKPVLVVEGEKTAEAARALCPELVVITWSGGAASVSKADWSILRERDVTLWPDNDEPGRSAMASIAEIVQPLASSVRLVEVPESLPKGWDLADTVPDNFDLASALAGAKEVRTGLRQHILTASELLSMPLPPQEYLIVPWLPKRGLAMVWATRGLGKTWFALSLAIAVAKGARFLEYEVPKPEVVLFVDGEMALGDLQERVRALCDAAPDNLHILPSERLFQAGTPLNINQEKDQQRVIDAIARLEREGVRPALVILDNLSSLTAGIDENDNSALDGIVRWLLGLRHTDVTVLIVHHANKAGDQRGASRREDQLNTSIKLAAPDAKDGGPPSHEGAHFIMEFTKVRGRRPKPMVLELKLVQTAEGRMDWAISNGAGASSVDAVLRYIAEHRPAMQKEIVDALSKSKSTISKACTVLEKAGFITSEPPLATEAGLKRVLDIWPDLYGVLARQGTLPMDDPL